jgi:hypothetical protein
MSLFQTMNFGRRKVQLIANLVAYYKFEVNSNDYVALNTGIDTDILYQTGKIGNSAFFGSTDSRINLVATSDLSFSDSLKDIPFTISLWLNFSDLSRTANWILNKRSGSSGNDLWQFVESGDYIIFEKFDKVTNSINQSVGFSSTGLSTNTWYHLVFTDNGTKTVEGMSFYLNGIKQTVTNFSNGVYTGMNEGINSATSIGATSWSTGNTNLSFKGKIDELGVWKNRALSQIDVNELYNAGAGKSYPF